MKFILLFILLSGQLCFGQVKTAIYLPVDSSDYFKLITFEGKSVTGWHRFEDVKYAAGKKILLGKSNNRWGVVDDSLQYIIPPKYDTIYIHENDIYAESVLRLDIYRDGKILRSIENFERIEFVQIIHADFKLSKGFIFHTLDFSVITDTSFIFDTVNMYDDAFFQDNIIYTRKGNRFGFTTLTERVEPEFTSIAKFNEWIMELTDKDNQRHYYFTDTRELPVSDSILQYHANYGLYKIYQNGKGELYDFMLNKVVNYSGEDVFCIYYPQGDYIGGMENKFKFAFKSNGKIGVCNEKGMVIIKPGYDHVYYVNDNRYIVQKDSFFGVIDNSESWVIDPVYTFIDHPLSGYFRVYNYQKKGLLDTDAAVIVPVEYEEVYPDVFGILTRKNNKFGYYNFEGIQILANNFDKAYALKQNCLEMVGAYSRVCVVNKHGLQTPLNCTNVYVGDQTLKYYLDNQIVVCHFENGIKSDSTVYERPSSIIVSRDQIRNSILIDDYNCIGYRNQLNGKIGSKNKEDIGDAIPAKFDNEFGSFSKIVKETGADYFYLGELRFDTKEILLSFSGYGCATYGPYYAYLASLNFGFWHSTELDPVLTTDMNFEYSHQHKLSPYNAVAMLSREGFASVSLTEGEINLQGGQPFYDYRGYYWQLNSFFNLSISDISTFSLLSDAPMIYVSDPVWHVLGIQEKSLFHLAGDFVYYEQLESGSSIYSYDNEKYGIYFEGEKNISDDIFDAIIPVKDDLIQYFYVQRSETDYAGVANASWSAYTNKGQHLVTFYDSVKLIHSGFFIVTQNEQRFVTDKSGRVIYSL